MSDKKSTLKIDSELVQFFKPAHVTHWPYPPAVVDIGTAIPNPVVINTTDTKIKLADGKVVSLDQLEKHTKVDTSVATKDDGGKLDWTLLPYDALEDIVKVLEFGAKKYARDNWRNGKGLGISRVTKSTMRHLVAYLRGEKEDPETGLSHWAHIGCNVLFVLHYLKHPDKYSNE